MGWFFDKSIINARLVKHRNRMPPTTTLDGGGTRTTALVPARGGSSSIPRKNLKELGDRPLVTWPIATAKSTGGIDDVFVTTDDGEIGDTAKEYGAKVINRPSEHAKDDSLVIDAIKHALDVFSGSNGEPDRMVLLEPTCPFRGVEDVEACLERLDAGYDSAATFVEAAVNPHRTWQLGDRGPKPFIDGANPWLPRQKLPEAHQLNGGCYAFKTAAITESAGPGLLFGDTAGVEMPPERSVDIDSPVDLRVARSMLADDEVTPL
jgi:N-acylneuraminate cytidylyltransferase